MLSVSEAGSKPLDLLPYSKDFWSYLPLLCNSSRMFHYKGKIEMTEQKKTTETKQNKIKRMQVGVIKYVNQTVLQPAKFHLPTGREHQK